MRWERELEPILKNLEAKLNQLAADLERLHHTYEQHFSGIQKREPKKEHDRFRAAFNSISMGDLKSTASKFKHQSITSRYVQYSQLWTKILKQIEEGTYKRDLFLLEKKIEREAETDHKEAKVQSAVEKTPPKNSKTQKQLETLYEKIKELAANQKLPNKEGFVAAVEKQLRSQQEKYPGKKFEVRLEKQTNGQFGIKIKVKAN